MNNYVPQIEELCRIAESLGNENIVNAGKFLKQRVSQPDSYVVCLGESCSGKSTILNSLIGEELLPVSGVPSTAAITEICFDNTISGKEFYAINKNATMEEINPEVFRQLALEPDAELERIRAKVHSDIDWSGIRIFDTPGYGSLVKEHEEVLMDFLPNCDAILYTVSYRVGIQDEDYVFLESMSNLTRSGIPFCLMINRCPDGANSEDVRIKEITRYVTSLLEEKSVPTILIRSFNAGELGCNLNSVNEIRDFIMDSVKSEERQAELEEAFKGYIFDLCDMINEDIDMRVARSNLSTEEMQDIYDAAMEYIKSLRQAKYDVVAPGFDKLKENFPHHVDLCANQLKTECIEEIKKQKKLDKEETDAYIKEYLLKRSGQRQAEELQFYLASELDAIDREVNDYLNKAIVRIRDDLKIRNVSEATKTGLNLVVDTAGKGIERGLLVFFAKYGGKGGSGAGIANAASHALKKFGEVFGKTFSRETHNALKHILAKLGLTSSRAVSTAVVVVIDALVFVVDINTWKMRLCNGIEKVSEKWAEDVKEVTLKDIDKLRAENIRMLEEIACEAERELIPFTKQELDDIEWLNVQKNLVEGIRRSIA